uniref:Uncharacterized protein LOC105051309 isoform X2 n=1 Tax=Elaeis guineensis var. tenera TaxID=51953 RepID=A0A6I9RXM0_ELAGV|nr:uncharacterized protein LOC105051309 isoform X2 [Elaeis guineensis]
MALFCVLAFLQVLALIAIASVKKASRRGSDEENCTEDVENQLGKEAKAEINPTTRQSYHEVHEHCLSQAEKSCGRKDNHPMVSQYHDDIGNNTLDQTLQHQPTSSAATTGGGAHEPAEDDRVTHRNLELTEATLFKCKDGQRESREEEMHRETEAEESREEERHREMQSASKFSYFSTGVSVAGIISIFSGYLGDQTGHAHTVPLKICTFFMLATFVSGASMLLLILINLSRHISIIFFRSLKYTAFGFLTLSMCSVSILFLKMFAILAFVPTVCIVLISFIMAWHPRSHDRGDSGMPFSRLSESV